MLLGLAWGLLLIGLWHVAFLLSWPHYLNWIAPALVCAAAMVAGPHRLAATAMMETAIGESRWQGRIVGAVFTLGISLVGELVGSLWRPAWANRLAAKWPAVRQWKQWLGLAVLGVGIAVILNHAVRWRNPDWPTHLPRAWAWLWPRAVYRVLLLMPVWGSWSMLALGQFHRPSATTDGPARHFAAGVSPLAAAAWLLAPLAGSLIYLNFLYPWHFLPGGGHAGRAWRRDDARAASWGTVSQGAAGDQLPDAVILPYGVPEREMISAAAEAAWGGQSAREVPLDSHRASG